jgi:uncharacterized protein YhaN
MVFFSKNRAFLPMRLTKFRLRNYGVFQNAELALSGVPGTIDLVVAPNGAGKSILRGALHDLLFGIHMQSELDFRYGYKGMELHAEAIASDGHAFDFGWRKQGKRFFLGDAVHGQARLAQALGEIRPQQLEYLFALDTQRLRKGGDELARGGDTLGIALLSGTGEMASAQQVRRALGDRQRAIYEKGRSKPPLNAAISALRTARNELREATQPPRERAEREQAVEAAQQARTKAEEAFRVAEERTRRLARIDRTRKFLLDLEEADAWLASNQDAPRLDQSLERSLSEARQRFLLADARLKESATRLADTRRTADDVQRDEAALAQEDALARLAGMVQSFHLAHTDLPKRQGEAERTEASIAGIMRDIGWQQRQTAAAGPASTQTIKAEAKEILPAAADIAAARAHIKRHESRLAAAEDAAKRFRSAELQLDEVRRLQGAEPSDAAPDQAAPEIAAIKALLREINAEGDPERAASEAENRQLADAAAVGLALSRVPGGPRSLEALRAAGVLPEPAFERLDKQLSKAQGERDKFRDILADLLGEREQKARALARLREARVAEPARLQAARALRDLGWRLIQQRVFAGTPDEAAERAHTGGEHLPVVFERHLREADAIADERATDSARVAESERLVRELADGSATEAAQAKLQAAEAALQASHDAWTEAVKPLGLDPKTTMAEVRQCLRARIATFEAAAAADLSTRQHDRLRQRHAAFADRLAALLGADAKQTLHSLVLSAERTIETEAAQAKRRIELKTKAENAARNLAQEQKAAEEAAVRLDEWRSEWRRILSRLGRPDGETPEATDAVLALFDGLRDRLQTLDALEPRIADMQSTIDGFAAEVARVAGTLGVACEPDPVATARALERRRQQALREAARWEAAQRALEKASADHDAAVQNDAAARLELGALVAATGADTAEEADERLAAARMRQRMEALRDDSRRALADTGEGMTIGALRAEADAIDFASMAFERDAAEAARRQAVEALQAAAALLTKAETDLAQAAAATSATEAAARHAAAAAVFGRHLDEVLVLHLASSMLARAMEAVEKGAGDDAVSRISRAFASVTGGAYAVITHDRADTPTLRVQELAFPQPFGQAIDTLSEGTRDQLYLALRMVALEDFTADRPPLPFIADDILQTFDDARALAALQALVDLSQHVQVIVLTHHQHIAGLASTLPGNAIRIRSLCPADSLAVAVSG